MLSDGDNDGFFEVLKEVKRFFVPCLRYKTINK